jgi:hypothetical protein
MCGEEDRGEEMSASVASTDHTSVASEAAEDTAKATATNAK